MAFIPAPEFTVRINWQGTVDGELFVNVMYASLDAYPASPAEWVTLANDLFDAYKFAWLDEATASFALREEVILTGCTVRDVHVEHGAEGFSTNAPFPGAISAGSLLPNEVSLCISWHTGVSGRSFRGRMYLPGISSAVLADANHIATDQVTAANLSATHFLEQIAGALEAPTPVIASYQADLAPRALAVVTPIINGGANSRLDSQRRRMPRL